MELTGQSWWDSAKHASRIRITVADTRTTIRNQILLCVQSLIVLQAVISDQDSCAIVQRDHITTSLPKIEDVHNEEADADLGEQDT